jgi:hypothetical protein
VTKPSFLSFFCLFAIAGSVPVIAAEPVSFKYEGADYTAKVTELKDGATLIAGREKNSGSTFRLTIREGQVRGLYGSSQVNFAVNDAEKVNIGEVIQLTQR